MGFMGSDRKSAKPAPGGVETLIGSRVAIKGDVHFSGGLYVDGTVHGAVIAEDGQADAVLTVSEKGVIHGEVRAPHIVVNGQLHGDVFAAERIELGPTARVEGNIHYRVVEMAAGAMITGRLIHAEVVNAKSLPRQAADKGLPKPADKALPKPDPVAERNSALV
jgi:cytoskeletal protein CcmA (bactofilin family)